MRNEVVVTMAEDDEGHAALIKRNLLRAGIADNIIQFRDGRVCLDFFQRTGDGPQRKDNVPYILLLDIKMPMVDGIEVLRKVKGDEELRKMPVIMLTTTEDPAEVENCYDLGCANYIKKPVDYDMFVDKIGKLGKMIQIIEVPKLK